MLFFDSKVKVLIVCTANICRSPMAQGLLVHSLEQLGIHRKVKVTSAGTHASQPGHGVDKRVQQVLAEEGVRPIKSSASQVTIRDLERNDFVLALDCKNLENLLEMAPPAHRHKIRLLMEFAPESGLNEVPDPYYGSLEGFRTVFRLINGAIPGLVASLSMPEG